MKMRPEHYAALHDALDRAPRLDPDAYAKAGLSRKRYRWDALYALKRSAWVCDTFYPYLNDEHMDTALRTYFNHPKELA